MGGDLKWEPGEGGGKYFKSFLTPQKRENLSWVYNSEEKNTVFLFSKETKKWQNQNQCDIGKYKNELLVEGRIQEGCFVGSFS